MKILLEDTSSVSPSNLLFDRKGIISEFINTRDFSSFQSSQVWKVCSGNLIMSSAELCLVSIPFNKDIQQRRGLRRGGRESGAERADKSWKTKIGFSDFNIYQQPCLTCNQSSEIIN